MTLSVNEISDRLELEQLIYAYGRIPDERRYDLVDRVFAEDGELVAPFFSQPVLKGREAIRAEMPLAEVYQATMHAVHNHRFAFDDTGADGSVLCVATHIFEKDGVRVKGELGVRYEDRYVRTAEGWRIARRELFVIWQHLCDLNETFIG